MNGYGLHKYFRKTNELLRLLALRAGNSLQISEYGKIVICIDLACSLLGLLCDKVRIPIAMAGEGSSIEWCPFLLGRFCEIVLFTEARLRQSETNDRENAGCRSSARH